MRSMVILRVTIASADLKTVIIFIQQARQRNGEMEIFDWSGELKFGSSADM